MNGKKYEIKPLECYYSNLKGAHCALQVLNGAYEVRPFRVKWDAVRVEPDGCLYGIADNQSTVEEAKIACERFHIESMEELLTEVKE